MERRVDGRGLSQGLTGRPGGFAQATLADNQTVMTDQNLPLLYGRYKEAQTVWRSGGRRYSAVCRESELPGVFEPAFVRKSADASLVSNRPPVNPSFHLTARPQVTGLTPSNRAG